MKRHLCGEQTERPETMAEDVAEMVEHLRLIHPDEYGDGPEQWPDGGIVIHDATIDPSDFTDPDGAA